jgi:hypothetical protein
MLVLLLAGSLYAQGGQCTLKLANISQAPELFGFHLGMTKEQVKARVPQVVFGKTDGLGVSKTTINPHFDPRIDQAAFVGVRSISLDFLDERLTSLWIGYDAEFKVTSVPEFIDKISKSLKLPDSWKPWRSRGQQMNCADFQLTVTMVADGPSFRILDLGAEETVAARREAQSELDSTAAEGSEEQSDVVADKKSKIYYPAGCQEAVHVATADRLVFKSAEEAVKSGFKPAKDCP